MALIRKTLTYVETTLIEGGKTAPRPLILIAAAAVLKNLDLLITCDTAIAHVAGALGVKVWVALSGVPDWRWLLHRDDSVWYDSVTLFRQHRVGDWSAVLSAIAQQLSNKKQT